MCAVVSGGDWVRLFFFEARSDAARALGIGFVSPFSPMAFAFGVLNLSICPSAFFTGVDSIEVQG